ncbi:MAG: hypothetical protein E2O75_04985 [Chloroflexi bacterium]|nr:MAG: hypothetical protein E2O75_04985 [Chloroflexota bacterium]
MAVDEASARAGVEAELLAIDWGGALTASSTAVIENLAEAFAKCIPHYASNNAVDTDDTGSVTGATMSNPGVFNGSGTGAISGLTVGDALAGTGLAGEIMTVLESADLGGTLTATARVQLALVADAVAVFADHVNDNAVVTVPTVTGPGVTPNLNGASTGVGTGVAL